MTRTRGGFAPLLATAPVRRFSGALARTVPKDAFDMGRPPAFLYSSGRPNRLNPRGVRCLYFSEDEQVAVWEFRHGLRGNSAELQPRVTFHAQVSLARVLDLEDATALLALGISPGELVSGWRGATRSTKLQRLGKAIDAQRRVVAVRFPSVAARAFGGVGWNLAVFLSPLRSPDSVHVVGPAGVPIETLP